MEVSSREPVQDRVLVEAMNEPEVAVETLVNILDAETTWDFRTGDARVAEVTNQVWCEEAGLSVAKRRCREFRSVLSNPAFRRQLNRALIETAVSEEAMLTWLKSDDNLERFFTAVPGFDVEATLMMERDRNRDHAPDPNDARDFSFLRVAVPYANVVVTERSWSHLVNASKLAEKYNTVSLADIRTLPEILGQLGCE